MTKRKRRPPLARRIEPLVWLTFSGGGVTAAMFLPVLAFLFALAFPLGWITPPSVTTSSRSCTTG